MIQYCLQRTVSSLKYGPKSKPKQATSYETDKNAQPNRSFFSSLLFAPAGHERLSSIHKNCNYNAEHKYSTHSCRDS